MRIPVSSKLIFALCLVFLMLVGVGVRRAVLEAQRVDLRADLPFTLESALQYRLIRTVFETGRVPDVDLDVGAPEGIHPKEVYSVGSEYVYALLARLFPSTVSLPSRLRWIQLLWFCTGIPLLGLWVRWLTDSRAAGVVAAAFYAVSLSAVMRSTGQELSRENFALPLLIAHLAFDALSDRRSAYSWPAGLCSALALVLAAMTWDLIQFYVLIWAAMAFVSVARKGVDGLGARKRNWLLQWSALVVGCLLNPYMRSHYGIFAPGMLLAHGVVLGFVGGAAGFAGRGRTRWILMAVPLAVGLVMGVWGYGQTYGHFLSLLYAKIRFLNQKPADPSLLSFEQRIMWVPGLNSSSWRLVWTIFPSMLVLTSIGAVVLFVRHKAHSRVRLNQQLVFFGASLVGFCFFVRFHVFLVIFATAILGWWFAEAMKSRWIARIVVVGLISLGLVTEAAQVLSAPERWGRPGVYYEELKELTEWVRAEEIHSPVLANFGVSASLLTYGGSPIVLHPKFESKGIRERVEAYGNALFIGNEEAFRDWADQYDVLYYVHSMGEMSSYRPRQQMRYMVDALEPPVDAAVRLFEEHHREGRYFFFLWGNRKYRVFQMLTKKEQRLAEKMSKSARDALQHGQLLEAEQLAQMALLHDPLNRQALTTVSHVDSLRTKDFDYDALRGSDDE